jgi:hypothetical protein
LISRRLQFVSAAPGHGAQANSQVANRSTKIGQPVDMSQLLKAQC